MLEKIYEEYKEGLSKSDHKIFGYLLEHEQELLAITAETGHQHSYHFKILGQDRISKYERAEVQFI